MSENGTACSTRVRVSYTAHLKNLTRTHTANARDFTCPYLNHEDCLVYDVYFGSGKILRAAEERRDTDGSEERA